MLYVVCDRCGRDIGPLDTSRQRFPDGLPERHQPHCSTLTYQDIQLTEWSMVRESANSVEIAGIVARSQSNEATVRTASQDGNQGGRRPGLLARLA